LAGVKGGTCVMCHRCYVSPVMLCGSEMCSLWLKSCWL